MITRMIQTTVLSFMMFLMSVVSSVNGTYAFVAKPTAIKNIEINREYYESDTNIYVEKPVFTGEEYNNLNAYFADLDLWNQVLVDKDSLYFSCEEDYDNYYDKCELISACRCGDVVSVVFLRDTYTSGSKTPYEYYVYNLDVNTCEPAELGQVLNFSEEQIENLAYNVTVDYLEEKDLLDVYRGHEQIASDGTMLSRGEYIYYFTDMGLTFIYPQYSILPGYCGNVAVSVDVR